MTYVTFASRTQPQAENCPICLEDIATGSTAFAHQDPISQVFHSLHPECLEAWVSRQPNCPLCRKSITQINERPVTDWLNEGPGIQYVPDNLRRQLAQIALAQNGLALKFASNELRREMAPIVAAQIASERGVRQDQAGS